MTLHRLPETRPLVLLVVLVERWVALARAPPGRVAPAAPNTRSTLQLTLSF
jgi:hypothetical protein